MKEEIEKSTKKIISKDFQIIKFCLYGFLKDIKFFDAYIVLFFLINGFSMLQIGTLIAIREAIIVIFEIPSGFISDKIGRKVELCICFIFYIISFAFYFFAANYGIAIVAMVFFGLGEAFRSGSHKAMIYTYLDQKEWTQYKSYVYGKTRSCSLLGAGISSILSVVLVLCVQELKWIFLATIIPYLLDFILIASYPNSLNFSYDKDNKDGKKKNIQLLKENFSDPTKGKTLKKLLVSEGVFESSFSIMKDYIQPIFESIIIGAGIIIFSQLSPDNNLKIVLGVVYALNSIVGSIFSKNAYRITAFCSKAKIINISLILLTILAFVSMILYKNVYVMFVIFLLLYMVMNIRIPIYVDELDNYMSKENRATMLSVTSGIKSLVVIVLSPILGYFVDRFGVQAAMIGLLIFLLCSLPISIVFHQKKKI